MNRAALSAHRISFLAAAAVVTLVALSWAVGPPPGNWSTVDGGGGRSSSGSLAITGTIGQHDAGTLTRNGWILRGGYWGGGATATGVGGTDETPVVAEFRMHPIHPNPFNPTTNIVFELPGPMQVNARIYNLRGELVRTLANRQFPLGRHALTWRGVDHNDMSVSSGVYVFAMDAGDHHVREKISLVR